MNVTINGQTETIAACSIAALVRQKGLDAEALVVEHNERIVQQAQWPDIQLQEGDNLELLSFVGGG